MAHRSPREAFHLSTSPIWQPDDSSDMCTICASEFNFWTRRHHCRACGRLVCNGCSSARLPIIFPSSTVGSAEELRDPSPDHVNLRQGASLQPATSTAPPKPPQVPTSDVKRVRVCDICEKIYRVSFYDHSQQLKKRDVTIDGSASSGRGSNSPTYGRDKNGKTGSSRNSREKGGEDTDSEIEGDSTLMSSSVNQNNVLELKTTLSQSNLNSNALLSSTNAITTTVTQKGNSKPIEKDNLSNSDSTSEVNEKEAVNDDVSSPIEVKDITELITEEPAVAESNEDQKNLNYIPSLLDEVDHDAKVRNILRFAPKSLTDDVKEMSIYHVCMGSPDGLSSTSGTPQQSGLSTPDVGNKVQQAGLSSPGTLRLTSPQARLQAARTLRQSRAAAAAAAAVSSSAESKSSSEENGKSHLQRYLIPYYQSAAQSLTNEAQEKRCVKYTAVSFVDVFNSLWTTTCSTLIDVRPPAAYADGHPPRSISLPMIMSGDVVPLVAPPSNTPQVESVAASESIVMSEESNTKVAADETASNEMKENAEQKDSALLLLPLSGLKELESRVPPSDSRAFRSRLNRQVILCGRAPAKLADIRKRLLSERVSSDDQTSLQTILGDQDWSDWSDTDEADETLYVDPCVVRLADLLLTEGRVSGVEILEAGSEAFLKKYPEPMCVCQSVPEELQGAEIAVRVDHKHTHVGLYPGFPSEVIDGFLFLGSRDNAKNLEHLKSLGVTHILNVTTEVESFFETEGHFKYLRLGVDDEAQEQLFAQFAQAFEFMDEAHTSGGRVLVHCYLGVSRSATVVLAYLIRMLKITTYQALMSLKTRRAQVQPNPGFLRQLCDFERIVLDSNNDSFQVIDEKFISLERNSKSWK